MPAVQTDLCNLDPHRLKTSSWQSFQGCYKYISHSVSIRVRIHLEISFRHGVLAERAPQCPGTSPREEGLFRASLWSSATLAKPLDHWLLSFPFWTVFSLSSV